MPKAKSKTHPHNESPRARGSVQARSAASHSLASTRVQVNESGAVPSPSSVATPQGSASQGMPVESLPSSISTSPEVMASSVVQQSVANAANSLTGLAVQAPLEMPGQLFQSAGLPVDARVSEKLRAKIWSNEYIDFGSLFTNPVFENQHRLTFQGADSGPVPRTSV